MSNLALPAPETPSATSEKDAAELDPISAQSKFSEMVDDLVLLFVRFFLKSRHKFIDIPSDLIEPEGCPEFHKMSDTDAVDDKERISFLLEIAKECYDTSRASKASLLDRHKTLIQTMAGIVAFLGFFFFSEAHISFGACCVLCNPGGHHFGIVFDGLDSLWPSQSGMADRHRSQRLG